MAYDGTLKFDTEMDLSGLQTAAGQIAGILEGALGGDALAFLGTGLCEGLSAALSGGLSAALADGLNNGLATLDFGGLTAAAAGAGEAVLASFAGMAAGAAEHTHRMMADCDTALKTGAGSLSAAAQGAASGVQGGFAAMVPGAVGAANQMMAGMLNAMSAGAGALYGKAAEIANKIAATLRTAWDEHSPSRVSYQIMDYFMLGLLGGMQARETELLGGAGRLALRLASAFELPGHAAAGANAQLLAAAGAGPAGLLPPAQAAGAGAAPVYNLRFEQHIETAKYLSPSELTREAQDFLRRAEWDIP